MTRGTPATVHMLVTPTFTGCGLAIHEIPAGDTYAAPGIRQIDCAGCLGGFTQRPEPTESTVKTVDLFGNVHDTFRTESELNGWKPRQGSLL